MSVVFLVVALGSFILVGVKSAWWLFLAVPAALLAIVAMLITARPTPTIVVEHHKVLAKRLFRQPTTIRYKDLTGLTVVGQGAGGQLLLEFSDGHSVRWGQGAFSVPLDEVGRLLSAVGHVPLDDRSG